MLCVAGPLLNDLMFCVQITKTHKHTLSSRYANGFNKWFIENCFRFLTRYWVDSNKIFHHFLTSFISSARKSLSTEWSTFYFFAIKKPLVSLSWLAHVWTSLLSADIGLDFILIWTFVSYSAAHSLFFHRPFISPFACFLRLSLWEPDHVFILHGFGFSCNDLARFWSFRSISEEMKWEPAKFSFPVAKANNWKSFSFLLSNPSSSVDNTLQIMIKKIPNKLIAIDRRKSR